MPACPETAAAYLAPGFCHAKESWSEELFNWAARITDRGCKVQMPTNAMPGGDINHQPRPTIFLHNRIGNWFLNPVVLHRTLSSLAEPLLIGREIMHVMQRLGEVFCDVFDAEDLTITRQSTAADVSGWDSLMHVRLMLAVEKAFGLRFTTSEIASFSNVGELVDAIERKVNNQPKG